MDLWSRKLRYKSVVTGSSSTQALDHDRCTGEFVDSKGRSSAPELIYLGGEEVVLNLSNKATSSSPICYHLGSWMGASISSVNKDNPFASYGTDTSLWDIPERQK